MFMYTVYDETAKESGPIFQAKNDGIALRNYRTMLKEIAPEVQGDYRLYVLGEFDHSTMSFDLTEPRCISFDIPDLLSPSSVSPLREV